MIDPAVEQLGRRLDHLEELVSRRNVESVHDDLVMIGTALNSILLLLQPVVDPDAAPIDSIAARELLETVAVAHAMLVNRI